MQTRSLALAVAMACLLPASVIATTNPIPGIGVVIKRHPGSSSALVVPGGFFGPGSEPFTGTVGLEGRCSHDCGGCDDNCAGSEGNPDGRIDYSMEVATGPFQMEMPATTMYSVAPIEVMIDGVPTFFDVFVMISGQSPPAGDPATGTLTLQSGSLDIGTWQKVDNSEFSVRCSITFADASTGVAAGSSIELDLQLELQETDLPVARIADGTASGYMVLGKGASSVVPFTFASAGDELVMTMLCLYEPTPVPVQSTSWGKVKALYR